MREFLHITAAGYAYDMAGNLTQDNSTSPASTYHWDAEGRLTSITQGSGTYQTNTVNDHGQVMEQSSR